MKINVFLVSLIKAFSSNSNYPIPQAHVDRNAMMELMLTRLLSNAKNAAQLAQLVMGLFLVTVLLVNHPHSYIMGLVY